MWERHWGLSRDPFSEADARFVATPSHAEAVSRLVHVITTGQRSAVIHASAGLGKSTILAQGLAEARQRRHSVALVRSPVDGTSLLAGLSEGLGLRVPPGSSRAQTWKRLGDAVRLAFIQGHSVVLAVDDCHLLTDAADRLDLERLVHLAPNSEPRLTVIQVGRCRGMQPASDPPLGWEIAIRVIPLTRSETDAFVHAKLVAAGRDTVTFTPRALACMHALSGGVPRGIDRMASLCLIIGAWRGLDVVPEEVVEGAARECSSTGSEKVLGPLAILPEAG